MPGRSFVNPYHHGTLLFDLEHDPEQLSPLVDDEAELRMAGLLVDLLRRTEAPPGQYERLGVPAEGPVTAQHLGKQVERTRTPPEQPSRTAGHSPFWAGSRIATHSTCEFIGKMPA